MTAHATAWPAPPATDWCLFLDRDGVINRRVDGDYVRSWAEFAFLPGVLTALRHLARWAPHVVVVTNQQGVGKGLMSEDDLSGIHERLTTATREAGGRLDDILHCPHRVTDGCGCRKPRAGMARRWLAEHRDVVPARCVVVGDSPSDMEMGRDLTGGRGTCVWIGAAPGPGPALADHRFDTLSDFSRHVRRLSPVPHPPRPPVPHPLSEDRS